MKKFDVAIIGAGTAGLTARRQVAEKTENYVIIDSGSLGTTCARVGCMPSKVLIQAANDFHRRHKLGQMGIAGGESLHIDRKKTMQHVRALRDRFVRGVLGGMNAWEDKLLRERATFVDANTLQVGEERIVADKIIVATGSRPIIPAPWRPYESYLVDTNEFFELDSLPESMAVIGLGVIGLELGQALSRLGVKVFGFTIGKELGGLTNPKLQNYAAEKLEQEFPIHYNGANLVGEKDAQLLIEADGKTYAADRALVAVGRRPNVDELGFENLGIELDKGMPAVDEKTMQVVGMPHLFLPGDANNKRPILHEAADEGTIAGHNAVNDLQCYRRRVALGMTFSDPNIATVGLRHSELVAEGAEFVIGEASFEGQGRAIVKLKEQGLLQVYVDKKSEKILGAELQAPDGEHLAHLLAWTISMDLSVTEVLRMPFYHPVIEEGLRTALRNAARQISDGHKELYRCDEPPVR